MAAPKGAVLPVLAGRPLDSSDLDSSEEENARLQASQSEAKRYNSSAVQQLLQRVALSEIGWHTTHKFTSTDKLRLQAQLRTQLIKVEVADAPPTLKPQTMLSVLESKL